MKILNETKRTVYDMEFEMSEKEVKLLLDIFEKECPEEEQIKLKINWSALHCMKKMIKEEDEFNDCCRDCEDCDCM